MADVPECKSCMAVSMSLGLSLVLDYVYATPEVKPPDPLPLVQDSNKSRGSASTSQKHHRNRLRENQEDHFYECLFCQEVFASRYDRNTHQKCHQKENYLKEFRCAWKQCSRGFETE
ncbi:GL23196 [Drosophila persimilis]|uniref:GL23196 n=1 Tax=Drosophila persimilis TaxID=7234 RepID=B4G5D1_DROPE|nr:GL23196 [Drosophila persimilis]